MAEGGVDPNTLQWREMFGQSVQDKFANQEKLLLEIRDLGRLRNGRIRKNELAIAGLKTWVTLTASSIGVVGIGVALLQALK